MKLIFLSYILNIIQEKNLLLTHTISATIRDIYLLLLFFLGFCLFPFFMDVRVWRNWSDGLVQLPPDSFVKFFFFPSPFHALLSTICVFPNVSCLSPLKERETNCNCQWYPRSLSQFTQNEFFRQNQLSNM